MDAAVLGCIVSSEFLASFLNTACFQLHVALRFRHTYECNVNTKEFWISAAGNCIWGEVNFLVMGQSRSISLRPLYSQSWSQAETFSHHHYSPRCESVALGHVSMMTFPRLFNITWVPESISGKWNSKYWKHSAGQQCPWWDKQKRISGWRLFVRTWDEACSDFD